MQGEYVLSGGVGPLGKSMRRIEIPRSRCFGNKGARRLPDNEAQIFAH